jgi:hypothetical protein
VVCRAPNKHVNVQETVRLFREIFGPANCAVKSVSRSGWA